MIMRELEDGTIIVEDECTRPLGEIQAEKQAALVENPGLDINPCSAVPLADLT